MKNLKLTLMLVLLAITSNAETDSTFYFLDKNSLTNNVLCNYTDSVYWGIYDGIKEKTLSNKYAFEIVSDLKYHAFGVNELPTVETIKINAATQLRQYNRIPVLIINYEYTRIKSTAIADSLIEIVDGKYYDILPRNQSPYETKTLFISAPVKDKIYDGNQSFYISRDFFISNLPDPQTIEIDFDDGQGYRLVSFGQTITVNYTSSTERIIKTRINTGGIIRQGFSFPSSETCQCGFPAVDERMTITAKIDFSNPTPYNMIAGQWFNPQDTKKSYANVYVKFGSGHPTGQFRKPLIFIEGIDFGFDSDYKGNAACLQPDEIRNGDVGWCEFWGQNHASPTNYLKGNGNFGQTDHLISV